MVKEIKMQDVINTDFWNELISHERTQRAGWELMEEILSDKVSFNDPNDKDIILGIARLLKTNTQVQQKFINARSNFLYEFDSSKVS